MQKQFDDWRKFVNEREEKLLREIDEYELEAIEGVLDDLKGSDIAFDALFGGKMRIVLDFPTLDNESELGKFIELLEKRFELKVDWERGMVSAQRDFADHAQPAHQMLGIGTGGEPAKRIQKKIEMKIGKFFVKLDNILKQHKELYTKIGDHKYGKEAMPSLKDYAAGMRHMLSYTGHESNRALSDEEQKRLAQVFNQLELYTGRIGTRDLYLDLADKKDWQDKEQARRERQDQDDRTHGKEPRQRKPIVVPDTKLVDLGKYWLENSKSIRSELQSAYESDTYSIIVTRHPIDVIRMSDYDNITSCHSPPSREGDTSYYKCAVAEAQGHGAIAYVVKTEELLYETDTGNIDSAEQEIQEGEIFYDPQRPNTGDLRPISRVRVRQMRHYTTQFPKRWDDGEELAVPEKRIYGKPLPGFAERVRKWARENQKETIGRLTVDAYGDGIDLDYLTLFGGSYEDTANFSGRKELLSLLLQRPIGNFSGEVKQNTETEDKLTPDFFKGYAGRVEAEVDERVEWWNNHYASTEVDLRVQHDEDLGGGVWIEPWRVTITIDFDLDDFEGLPNSYPTGMHAADYINDMYGTILKVNEAFLTKSDPNTVRWGCDVNFTHPDLEIENMGLMHDVGEVDDFCETIDQHIDERREHFKEILTRFFKNEGYMSGGGMESMARRIIDGELDSYVWDLETDDRYDAEEVDSITASAKIDFGAFEPVIEMNPKVLMKIANSRDFRTAARVAIHKPVQEELNTEYYVDTVYNTWLDASEDVIFEITFGIRGYSGDEQARILEAIIEQWDDEDELREAIQPIVLQAVNTYLPSHMQKNLDESKKNNMSSIFDSWRKYAK